MVLWVQINGVFNEHIHYAAFTSEERYYHRYRQLIHTKTITNIHYYHIITITFIMSVGLCAWVAMGAVS